MRNSDQNNTLTIKEHGLFYFYLFLNEGAVSKYPIVDYNTNLYTTGSEDTPCNGLSISLATESSMELLDECRSTKPDVISCVHHASVVGLLLFSAFFNDLPEAVNLCRELSLIQTCPIRS